MFEYVAVAGGGVQDWWTGQVLPFLDAIRASPYFWPGAAIAAVAFILATRQIIK